MRSEPTLRGNFCNDEPEYDDQRGSEQKVVHFIAGQFCTLISAVSNSGSKWTAGRTEVQFIMYPHFAQGRDSLFELRN